MKTRKHFANQKAQVAFFCALLFTVVFSSCKKSSDSGMESGSKVNYTGSFIKSSSDVSTSASGSVSASYDPATYQLSYTINWSGLSSEVSDMHFHDNGPVIVHIEGFSSNMSGSVTGTATLTKDQESDLAAGKIYAQIHTMNYPAGEIKATLTKESSSSSNNNNGGGGGY
ncbi:MAG TPA: CHRD domain-containing protein [Sunxiuqinia sp.]|nr:CHRD domain-containing protein [Sunxiuqinia sp.]